MKKTLNIFIILVLALNLSSCSLFDEDLNEINKTTTIDEGFRYTSRKKLSEKEVPDEYRSLDIEESDDYDITYEEVEATSSYSDICSMGH